MNLIPWKSRSSPPANVPASTHPVDRLRSEMDRMFDRFFSEPFGFADELAPSFGAVSTAIDVTESEDGVVVRAEVPGVEPGDIDITLRGDVLSISGEKKEEHDETREGWHRTERTFGSFRRTVQLPSDVDPDSVDAEHKHGVLTIRLKKSETAKPKRIEVKGT
jgi:HSP20 family protein